MSNEMYHLNQLAADTAFFIIKSPKFKKILLCLSIGTDFLVLTIKS